MKLSGAEHSFSYSPLREREREGGREGEREFATTHYPLIVEPLTENQRKTWSQSFSSEGESKILRIRQRNI